MTDTLSRLRAANPANADDQRGQTPTAQAALERILGEAEGEARPGVPMSPPPRRTIRSPRGLALVFALLVLGAGGALAATDPMGWWASAPGQASYGANVAVHVRTPSAQDLRCGQPAGGALRCVPAHEECGPTAGGGFRCILSGHGLAYMKEAAIPAPQRVQLFTRASFLSHLAASQANGTVSAADAARFRADIAAVPNSFFTMLRLADRFGTFGSGTDNAQGQTLVPPAGIPDLVVCVDESGPDQLSCRDLNGDLSAPVGAGVYAAKPAPGWRVAPANGRQTYSLPPGVHFTAAEYRVLIDMARTATVTHSGSSGRAQRVRVSPLPAPRRAARAGAG